MTYIEIIQKVSEDTGIPASIVDRTYKAFWLYIRNSVKELPLKLVFTETEFLNLKSNFNIPSLGKLTCTYDRYKRVKNKFQHIKNIREKNEKTD